MPGLASILYTDGSLRKVELEKAVAAYNALTGLIEPTPEQADWLCTIQRIFLPPSARPANYTAVSPFAHEKPIVSVPRASGNDTNLTNQGRLQGRSEQIPLGDQ
jgi:hypothetical protein